MLYVHDDMSIQSNSMICLYFVNSSCNFELDICESAYWQTSNGSCLSLAPLAYLLLLIWRISPTFVNLFISDH